MKIRNYSVLFSIILCFALLLSPAVPHAADTDPSGKAESDSSASTVAYFIRTSSSSGHAFVYSVSAAPSKIVSKVTLESAEEGSGSYTQAGRSLKKTVYNAAAITQIIDYPLETGKDYRIKVEITDTCNGLTTTSTTYRDLAD